MSHLSNVRTAGFFRSSKQWSGWPSLISRSPLDAKKCVGMPSGGFKNNYADWVFSNLSQNFTLQFLILLQHFSPLWLRGDHFHTSPGFHIRIWIFKYFWFCCVHVIKLTFLTASQIIWLNFVALPLRVSIAFKGMSVQWSLLSSWVL